MSSDLSKVDKNVCLQGANMCLGLLKTYSSQLEVQMNKLTTTVGLSDPELAEKVWIVN